MEDALRNALQWRYAVRKFDPAKKITPNSWKILEEALILTPSSYGLQPWKFFIIESQEKKQKLRLASWNQSQVTDCSHLVVFTVKEEMTEAYIDEYMESISQVRGVSLESVAGFKKGIIADIIHGPRSKMIEEWASRQCYIALGNFMTSASIISVDTCPLEGFEPLKYDEILNLNGTGYKSVVACAAGYRSADDPLATRKKVRFPASKMIVKI